MLNFDFERSSPSQTPTKVTGGGGREGFFHLPLLIIFSLVPHKKRKPRLLKGIIAEHFEADALEKRDQGYVLPRGTLFVGVVVAGGFTSCLTEF
jgi:hypothetical protein